MRERELLTFEGRDLQDERFSRTAFQYSRPGRTRCGARLRISLFFDPDTVAARSTFENPTLPPVGIFACFCQWTFRHCQWRTHWCVCPARCCAAFNYAYSITNLRYARRCGPALLHRKLPRLFARSQMPCSVWRRGQTPVKTYAELRRMNREGLSFFGADDPLISMSTGGLMGTHPQKLSLFYESRVFCRY